MQNTYMPVLPDNYEISSDGDLGRISHVRGITAFFDDGKSKN